MNIASVKTNLKNHVKNIYGWKTRRKIVVFSVDDYGNVRVDSREARARMDAAGLKVYSRFDALDHLETTEDLMQLFETLSSVQDKNGRNAVFTPFALPCNIDFEAMRLNQFTAFSNELLPVTFEKLESYQPKAYSGAWKLWKEGIQKGIMVPQFHGREHLNLSILSDKLKNKSHDVLVALENRSYTSIDDSAYPTMNFPSAFDFCSMEENLKAKELIRDGLEAFEKVYGYKAVHFNSPGGGEHPSIHAYLFENGIKYIDAELNKTEHQGDGVYKKVISYTGKTNDLGMVSQVRNVVFEPTEEKGVDWVAYSMKQIEAAFFWNRPAIISSHRVNFCGHLDPKNRQKGIEALRNLLRKIVQKWPDVEFMAAPELGALIQQSKQKA